MSDERPQRQRTALLWACQCQSTDCASIGNMINAPICQSLKYDRCKPVHPKPLQRAKKECQPVGQHPDLIKNGKFVYYTAPAVRQVVAGVAVCVCLTATAEYRLQTVQRQNKTLQHFFLGGAFSYQPLPVCNRHNVKKRIFNAF